MTPQKTVKSETDPLRVVPQAVVVFGKWSRQVSERSGKLGTELPFEFVV